MSVSTSHRLSVASRVLAAVLGGYTLTIAASIFLSRVMPASAAEGVMTATIASFTIFTCAILWAFAARSASRAWFGIAALGGVFLVGALLLGNAS
jgi:hypothetical protein